MSKCEPDDKLIDSIRIRGVAIPVRVIIKDNKYVCVDGQKRLSACALLGKEEEKFLQIPIMILNDFSKSGSSYWGNTQNHH